VTRRKRRTTRTRRRRPDRTPAGSITRGAERPTGFRAARLFATALIRPVTLGALELIWTRLFSAEFFCTFAFLTLSLAVLGLWLGALALRLVPGLDREHQPGPILSLRVAAALLGPPVTFLIGVDFACSSAIGP
jgi:hypothetical protein